MSLKKRPLKSLHNKTLTLAHGFIALYMYKPENQQLFITMRGNCNQYRYDGVTITEFNEVLKAPSKMQALRRIMQTKSAEFVQKIAVDDLRLLTMPRNQYNHLAR